MQPSTSSGRKAPLALLPFSWGIAFATVAGVFKIVACVRGAGSRRYPQSAILGAILVSGQLCVKRKPDHEHGSIPAVGLGDSRHRGRGGGSIHRGSFPLPI